MARVFIITGQEHAPLRETNLVELVISSGVSFQSITPTACATWESDLAPSLWQVVFLVVWAVHSLNGSLHLRILGNIERCIFRSDDRHGAAGGAEDFAVSTGNGGDGCRHADFLLGTCTGLHGLVSSR